MLVHRKVTHSSKLAGTHLYTWVKGGTVSVMYLALEHNAVPEARTRTVQSGVQRTNHQASATPTLVKKKVVNLP